MKVDGEREGVGIAGAIPGRLLKSVRTDVMCDLFEERAYSLFHRGRQITIVQVDPVPFVLRVDLQGNGLVA